MKNNSMNPIVIGWYVMPSKKSVENNMAMRHARTLSHEALTDFTFVGLMQRMVNIPADAKLLRPIVCASKIDNVVPRAVLIVRYPIRNFIIVPMYLPYFKFILRISTSYCIKKTSEKNRGLKLLHNIVQMHPVIFGQPPSDHGLQYRDALSS